MGYMMNGKTYNSWAEANPKLAKELTDAVEDNVPSPEEMFKAIDELKSPAEATRVSGFKVIQDIAKLVPQYVSGSADLHGSTRNYINDGGNFGAGLDKTYAGRNMYFGIREHAMGAILNGFGYHGIFKASGSTFLVFVDYFRPTVRVASLAELNRVSYILTHDSIGVGEDGPTHQPVETVSGLRVIPNLDVFRPADAEETVAAYVSSVTRKDGPTALILSRQNIEQNDDMDYMARREGALKGGYVAKKEEGDLDMIIIASGSEVPHALNAAKSIPVLVLFLCLVWKHTNVNPMIIRNLSFHLVAPNVLQLKLVLLDFGINMHPRLLVLIDSDSLLLGI